MYDSLCELDVDSPSLLIDLDGLEHNLRAMAAHILASKCVWRPHVKAIRCAALARKMLDAGAIGVTCAKVAQASAMVDGGILDVLVANEVVGTRKIDALIALAQRGATVGVACDDETNMRELSAAAAVA